MRRLLADHEVGLVEYGILSCFFDYFGGGAASWLGRSHIRGPYLFPFVLVTMYGVLSFCCLAGDDLVHWVLIGSRALL